MLSLLDHPGQALQGGVPDLLEQQDRVVDPGLFAPQDHNEGTEEKTKLSLGYGNKKTTISKHDCFKFCQTPG